MPTQQPTISFQQLRNLTEKWTWRDPGTGLRITGYNPPSDALEKEGYLEQGEVVTLKVNLRRHQRKVLFVTSGEIRVLRDYLIIEVDGMRILTH